MEKIILEVFMFNIKKKDVVMVFGSPCWEDFVNYIKKVRGIFTFSSLKKSIVFDTTIIGLAIKDLILDEDYLLRYLW